jgi:hypothetical protein
MQLKKSYFKRRCNLGTLRDFLVKMPVILKYLFIGAFCHKGKFIFLKSTLNSALILSWDGMIPNKCRQKLFAEKDSLFG